MHPPSEILELTVVQHLPEDKGALYFGTEGGIKVLDGCDGKEYGWGPVVRGKRAEGDRKSEVSFLLY